MSSFKSSKPNHKTKKTERAVRKARGRPSLAKVEKALFRNPKKARSFPSTQRQYGHRPEPTTIRGYADALNAPFERSPPRVGWGTLMPTSLKLAYCRGTWGQVAADTCFALISPLSNTGIVRGYSAPSAATLLSAAVTVGTFNSFNQNFLANTSDTGRVISGGLRVSVRMPATVLPGRLFGGLFYTNLSDLTALTFDALTTLPNTRQVYVPQAGGAVEVQFRPADDSSFTFFNQYTDATGWGTSTNIPYLVVIGTGFPAGVANWQAGFDCISHLESNIGNDDDVDDGAPTDTISDSVGMDMGFRALTRLLGDDVVTVASEAVVAAGNRVLAGGTGRGRRVGASLPAPPSTPAASASSSGPASPPVVAGDPAADEFEELDSSIHIPRGVLSKFMRKQ